ncbi:MAG TPA: hypothetical protein VEC18_07360, partial [Myxococcota bacterium]|nr:hypothetical protein [Myxococcota bacterium]
MRAAVALCALVAPRAAIAWGSTMDPVFVYYPQRYCEGDRIALEVWDRAQARWVAHPSHPVIRTDSCQLEDAGVLLNEIRWRCLTRERSEPGEPWSVGVRVFQPEVMQHCEVSRAGDGFGDTEIHFTAPEPGATLADADGHAEIEGSVWIGGLAGDQYDVVIAIDTSAHEFGGGDTAPALSTRDAHALPDPLAAQLAAARGFVAAVRARLGAVRIGIVSFPGDAASGAARASPASPARSADGAEPLEARRELALSDDRVAIERAL